MFRLIAALVAGLALLSVLATAQAGKVKVWYHRTPAQHDKAQFKQAVLSSEGAVRLARQLKPLAALEVAHVWDIVEDQQGNLYVATGSAGKIYKVTPDGKTTAVFEGQESQVFCLALAPDGSVYAGTGPSGLVIRITPDGSSRVIYDSPESYVWALAVAARGETIYAGTGPKGRIYQLTPDGKASVFYTTRQEHVLSLACGHDAMLYAGTDKNGLVYRIDQQGKAFVLFQAPQTEVRSLLATPDGVFAGTSSPSARRSPGSSSGSDRSSGSGSSSSSVPPGRTAAGDGKVEKTAADDDKSSSSSKDKDKESEKGSPAPSASPPGAGDNSVYCIAPDGSVRELFREKALVLRLLRHNGRVLIGTGMEGRLYEVNEATKEKSELARLDHGQIQCLCRRRDGSVVIGTGDPGKLYVLQDRYAAKGTVVSDVLDAKMVSKWGALRWKAHTPAGTSVTVAVRSGNVVEPDETWSDWSLELADPENSTSAAPPARFLQYRLSLTTTNPDLTPALSSLSLRYLTANQAPEVTSVEVPDLDAVNLDNPKKLKIKWSANDPNEDELTYSLHIRKDGWKSWVRLEESLIKTEYEWDATTVPAGVYQIKVVASDRKDNPAEQAQSGARVSAPVAVAHVPPAVTVNIVGVEGDQAVVEATAVDPLVRLTAASFAVDGKNWLNVFPVDGLFDSKTETFRFKTEALKPGTHVLVMRVRDAAGNMGAGDVVFTLQPRPKPEAAAGQ